MRYLAARAVLHEHDHDALYLTLLGQLGCADCDRQTVQHHLDELADVFDAAAAVAETPFFFSADITGAARPVALHGSQALVDAGDHREAVFWIVATFARCQQVFAADGSADLYGESAARFRAAVRDLLGIRDTAALLARRDAVGALLPELWEAAAAIASRTTSRTESVRRGRPGPRREESA